MIGVQAVKEHGGKVGSGAAAVLSLGLLELGRRYMAVLEGKHAAQEIGTSKALECGQIQASLDTALEVVKLCCGP